MDDTITTSISLSIVLIKLNHWLIWLLELFRVCVCALDIVRKMTDWMKITRERSKKAKVITDCFIHIIMHNLILPSTLCCLNNEQKLIFFDCSYLRIHLWQQLILAIFLKYPVNTLAHIRTHRHTCTHTHTHTHAHKQWSECVCGWVPNTRPCVYMCVCVRESRVRAYCIHVRVWFVVFVIPLFMDKIQIQNERKKN